MIKPIGIWDALRNRALFELQVHCGQQQADGRVPALCGLAGAHHRLRKNIRTWHLAD